MDPNAALEEFRAANAEFDQAPDHDTANAYATVALMAAQALDEWLSRGGFLPTAWVRDELSAMMAMATIINYWRTHVSIDGNDFVEFMAGVLGAYGADLSLIEGSDAS